ncbi:hypothetical protein [Streptomyces sp. NBC_01465]|uniref:hypothetical protein n=1 Tax=Streptomyces sp. NBC_01465 TaxID=2903878 RepID=UPI002E3107B1|nr:hypothetical protein [Streptomyces sp. NBC_01465]
MPKWRVLFWLFVFMAVMTLGSLRTVLVAHRWGLVAEFTVVAAGFAGAAVYVARRRRAERDSA